MPRSLLESDSWRLHLAGSRPGATFSTAVSMQCEEGSADDQLWLFETLAACRASLSLTLRAAIVLAHPIELRLDIALGCISSYL